ncbi:hypothetical protein ACWEF9_08230 [Streptomyces sp. NPDC004980]
MIIAGVSEGLVPRASVDQWEKTDRTRHERELQRARSLPFVAVIRARDALVISWNGEVSRFLTPLRAAVTVGTSDRRTAGRWSGITHRDGNSRLRT